MKTRHFTLTIFLFLALSVCLPPTAMSADGDSDVRPGVTNPVTTSRRTLFRDDELMLFRAIPYDRDMGYMYAVPADNDLTSWTKYYEDHGYGGTYFGAFNDGDRRPIASARGRTADHEHDYAVYTFFRPDDGKVMVQQYDPNALVDGDSGRNNKWTLFSGSTFPVRSLDIALGDLDGRSDDDGWYHDEIVVVNTTTDGDVAVRVMDHDDLDVLAYEKIPYDFQACNVAVDIGDLNGDGYLEIVVGMQEDWHSYKIVVYTFSNDGVIQFVKASTYTGSDSRGGDFDLAVGDFDRDGKDEVFLASSSAANLIELLGADDDLTLHREKYVTSVREGVQNTLRVVSGLFKFDPTAGWPLSRRQAAVCYQESRYSINCIIYEVHTNQHITANFVAEISPADDGWSIPYEPGFTSMDLTTGNFVGHGVDEKETSPVMDLAVSYVECKGDQAEAQVTKLRPAITILSPRSGEVELEDKWTWTGAEQVYDQFKGNWQMATTVTAADGDGDTYRLGAPAHIVMDNVLRLDHIIQEPPKHVDYLPIDYNNPEGEWEVVNVSGYSDFAASFSYSSTDTTTTETTSTSSWDIGGGAELDVQFTTVEGNMDIAGVKTRLETDTKLGYDYKENKSTYNLHYGSETYTESVTTTTDDALKGLTHTIDVWRYPIVGYYDADSDNPYGYQEIVMPGPALGFESSGKAHPDWYQPFHENHNLLSYPLFANLADWTPADLGSFNVGDKEHKIVMNPKTVLSWGGDTFYEEYDWTVDAGSGSEKDYNNTLSESEEITASVKARAKLIVGSDTIKATGKISFHNSNSWGGSTVSKTTHSNTKGFSITLTQQDNPSSSGYAFMPSAYITDTGGAFKVAYAVGPNSTYWGDWWKHYYGSKPDPALNLPIRLKWHQADQAHGNTEYWYLNTDSPGPMSPDSPMYKMRGFFLREFGPLGELQEDSDTQKPPLISISSMIVDGDIVNLCARVYNYSLSEDTTGPFDVRFYYYPLDTSNAKPLPDTQPVSQSGMVATANLDSLDTPGGTSRTEVCVGWDTTGLSTEYQKWDKDLQKNVYVNTFRFQVVLDEDDEVDEIHELWDKGGLLLFAPGTNNFGTFPWSGAVTVSNNPDPGQPAVDLDRNDLRIAAGSMAVKTGQGIVSTDDKGGPLHLELGKTYEIRALVQADQDHPFHRLLLLYDGDPDGKDKGKRKGHPAGKGKGNPDGKGKVIGSTKVYGIEAESQYVWTRWTPDTLGKQEIWMRLLEDADEVNPGNAIDSLKVIVVPAKKSKSHPKKSK